MLGVIIFSVVLIALCVVLYRAGLTHYYKHHKNAEAAPVAVPVKEEDLPEELVVAIIIAAQEMLQKPIVVKAIHFLDTPQETSWSRDGRLNLMTSHTVKK